MIAPAEGADTWKALLLDLYRRRLQGRELRLVVTDGKPGMIKALSFVWPRAAHQRCWVHKLRNLSNKLKASQQSCVAEARDIYNLAHHRREAVERSRAWKRKWQASASAAMLVKIYGNQNGNGIPAEVRYSPAQCMGARKAVISGRPAREHVSTSHVERQNLSMRMSMRRFTRLTNGFSKKLENQEHALALYFMYYNFARVHQSLRVTPAMEAGIADHVWSLEEIVDLLK